MTDLPWLDISDVDTQADIEAKFPLTPADDCPVCGHSLGVHRQERPQCWQCAPDVCSAVIWTVRTFSPASGPQIRLHVEANPYAEGGDC